MRSELESVIVYVSFASLSSGSIDRNTVLSLEFHLHSRKPPRANNSCTSLLSSTTDMLAAKEEAETPKVTLVLDEVIGIRSPHKPMEILISLN